MSVSKKYAVISALLVLLASPLFLRGAGEIKFIQSSADLPEPFCSLGQKGDILVADGKSFILIGATPRPLTTSYNYPHGNAMGSILGFVPAGKNLAGDLNIGAAVLRIKDRSRYVVYSQITEDKAKQNGSNFIAQGIFEDIQGRYARIKTSYLFHPEGGRVDISSTLTNTGKAAFEELGFSLFFDAYARYSFNPYHEEKFPALNFRVYQKKGHYLGWINLNPVDKEEKRHPGRLAPGEECSLRYVLLVDISPAALLERIYRILDINPVKAAVAFKDFDGDWLEIVVREAFTSSIFFRSILEKPLAFGLLLPPGVYRFQANFFPASVDELVEVKPEGENVCELKNPPLGTVKVRIKSSQGDPVPGKVTFLGLYPTKTPYFRPDNPVETGRSWEGFKNSCFPPEAGSVVKVPVGTYLVYASRGPEYTIDEKVVEVLKEDNGQLIFTIDRVVKTPGIISFDPHLHTQNSDGAVSVPERIKSLVAEGVEAAAATDHNIIIDYSAALGNLKLEPYLTVIPGTEVTTPDVIHFNTYPMAIRPDETGNGVIDSTSDEAGPLFLASRRKNPGVILQVNHPRAGSLGYFNNFCLDQESAATALISFDTDFNLLEVLNGPYFHASNQVAVEDWLHLLNRGYFFPIVGSSDAHTIDRGEPGYARTYVFSAGETGDLDWKAVFQALKRGRSFATTGPVVEFKVDGRHTSGDLAKAGEGRVDIWFKIKSAPWVAVDEVRLILNGQRRIIFPVEASPETLIKIEQEISLALKEDTYICVEALGKKTLFPVLQRPSASGRLEDGTIPYALTNPIFIDVDGNGRFDPPLTDKIRLTSEPKGSFAKISR